MTTPVQAKQFDGRGTSVPSPFFPTSPVKIKTVAEGLEIRFSIDNNPARVLGKKRGPGPGDVRVDGRNIQLRPDDLVWIR